MANEIDNEPALTDTELLYAAGNRCRCGAGLAYPLDSELSFKLAAWVCSKALKGDVEGEHDSYPWAYYKVREETSINNVGGYTSRPSGTVAMTVGNATCPECGHQWHSEPYSACGLGHHWFSGACPNCGYAVGAAGTWSSNEGEPIKHRYSTVVLPSASENP